MQSHTEANTTDTMTTKDTTGAAARLNNLLGAGPVDLTRVSDEIRANADLETLIMKLTASLVLSPEVAATSIEEAAVVLGTYRLRVLVRAWSLLRQSHDTGRSLEDLFPRSAPPNSPAASAASWNGGAENDEPGSSEWTYEALYLATFLRWLEMDSQENITVAGRAARFGAPLPKGDVGGLAGMFMRDFLSLIPALGADFLKFNCRTARAGAGASLSHRK